MKIFWTLLSAGDLKDYSVQRPDEDEDDMKRSRKGMLGVVFIIFTNASYSKVQIDS